MKRVILLGAVAILIAVLGVIWMPFQATADTFTAANKFGVSASDVQIMNQNQQANATVSQEYTLFDPNGTTFKTSTPRDLIVTLNMECGLYTAVGAKGSYNPLSSTGTIQTSSTAIGQVIAWVELDGHPLATTLANPYNNIGDPNADPPTTSNGPVVFCNRAFNLSTQNFNIDQLITLFIKTRDAHSYSWFALNVGNGTHTLVVKSKLVAETASSGNGGSVTITYTPPAASALVGQRTLIVEPVNLQNSATY